MDSGRRKVLGWKGLYAVLCILLSGPRLLAEGGFHAMITATESTAPNFSFTRGLTFRPPIHEPRIYVRAPGGVHVTTIHAYDPNDPRKPIMYGIRSLNTDSSYFLVDKDSGNLTTARYIDKEVDDTYEIKVFANGSGLYESTTMLITVTEINQYPPEFERTEYEDDVHVFADVNTSILSVKATDKDPIPYNAEIYYRMDQNESSKYFRVNQQTGELTLNMQLDHNNTATSQLGRAPKKLVFSIFAEDGGSPKQWAQAQIRINVKTISEPRNITVTNITESSATICWSRPQYGEIERYIMICRVCNEKAIEPRPLDRICDSLVDLEPRTVYTFQIVGQNRRETGIISHPERFTTRYNFCQKNVCKNGVCQTVPEEPGYVCNCSKGYYGKTCDMFDPCSPNPCKNSGICFNSSQNEYTCECQRGYSGQNCSETDICISLPCGHGGICEKVNEYSYKCNCISGYYGDKCQHKSACLSEPCQYNGTCNDGEISGDYFCTCPPGYRGKNCEHQEGSTTTSPCQNGGTLVDGDSTICNCPSGFHGTNCELAEMCKAERTVTEKATFYWIATKHGEMAFAACPTEVYDNEIAKRRCLLLPNGTVQWSEVDMDDCLTQGFKEAVTLADQLKTKDPDTFSAEDFQQAPDQIEAILHHAIYDEKLAKTMVSIISNLLDVNETIYEAGDKDGMVTKRLVQQVDTFMSNVKLNAAGEVSISSANIVLKAVAYNYSSEKHAEGLSFVPSSSIKEKREARLNENRHMENTKVPSIKLTKQVFELAKEQLMNQDVRAKFAFYNNDKFFRTKIKETCYNVKSDGTCIQLISFPEMQVIQASVNNISIVNLSNPVVYTLPVKDRQEYVCVYWDDFERKWSLNGLTTSYLTNQTYCSSTHLTAFSYLLSPTQDAVLSKSHKLALSAISYVGSALSIVGLVLTIMTYSFFRCLNRDHSGKILINLCVSLFLLNASFLLSSYHGSSQQGTDICTIVAILIHYFVLTSLAWMCVEAVNMYQLLIYVFASAETHFLLKRFILAWGGPFIVVSITAGVNVRQYKRQNEFCMLSPSDPYIYYMSFLGPSCIMLLANCVVFIMVTKVLFTPRMTTPRTGENSHKVTTAQVRGAFTVMVLLGVTWIFGAFAVGDAKLVFQYLFCILNSLQGFLIFVVRCLHYHEARKAWMQLFRTGTFKKHRGVMLSGSWWTNSNSVNKQNGHYKTTCMVSANSENSGSTWYCKDNNVCNSSECTTEYGESKYL